MTLVVHGEEDILDAQIAFHLNAGVDFVVVTHHRPTERTAEILTAYGDLGLAHVIEERSDDFRQGEWVTRMVEQARSDFGADWIFHSDADEFWWPRWGTFAQTLSNVPERYGIVDVPWRMFVARSPTDEPFYERMTVRAVPRVAATGQSTWLRTTSKVMHRAVPGLVVADGNHGLSKDGGLLTLRGSYPFEILHFPIRGKIQAKRKPYTVWPSDGHFESLIVGDEELARGLAHGTLMVDERLRDALRVLRRGHETGSEIPGFALPADGASLLTFRPPDLVDEMAWAEETAQLLDGEIVRLRKGLDFLERRTAALEETIARRVRRRLLRVAGKA
jgi:hypothetical protein